MRPFASFCAAWTFLTRIPLPPMDLTERDVEQAPAFYPLVGLLIGVMGAAGYVLGDALVGPVVGALTSLATTLMATGVFHEDGLADLFDGLGARTREDMLEFMRDSRLGSFGVVGLWVVLGLKVANLAALPAVVALAALPYAHGLSRMSAVAVIATSRYARVDGAAKPVAKGIERAALAIATLTSLTAWVVFGRVLSSELAIVSLGGLAMGHGLSRLLFERTLGGYTGDCLGAVQQISELGIYFALAAST